MTPQDAMQFANGSKDVRDADLRNKAKTEALRQYGDMVQNGSADNIKDVNAWVEQTTAENYDTLKAGPSGGAAAPGGPTMPGPAGSLPPGPLSQLQKAGGRPLKFKNGQVWKMVNGRPVRVA